MIAKEKKRERSYYKSEDKMPISENLEEIKSENNIKNYNKTNFKRKTYTIHKKVKNYKWSKKSSLNLIYQEKI